MRSERGATAYLEAQVLGSSREQLVVLLYDHLLAQLGRAKTAIAAGDIERKAASLEKASAIVFELLASLDQDKGGELASRLAALYAFFISEIGAAGRSMDAHRLDNIVQLVGTLREAWSQAAGSISGGPTRSGEFA
jgi:flagellar protein FliS